MEREGGVMEDPDTCETPSREVRDAELKAIAWYIALAAVGLAFICGVGWLAGRLWRWIVN